MSKDSQVKTAEATWKSNKNILNAHSNHTAWALRRETINAMSTGKGTTDQCKSKIKRLKEDYKNVKDSNKKSGVAPVLFTLSPI